ncbi:MAG: DMT family transporter [Pseudomonadota bacterium]
MEKIPVTIKKEPPHWFYIVLLLVVGTAWGFQFSMLKTTANHNIPEIGVLFVSLFLLSTFFIGVIVVAKLSYKPRGRHILYFFIGSILGYVIPIGVTLYVADLLSAGMLALIASMTPVVTVVIVLILRTENVSGNRLWAIALGMAAAIVIIFPELLASDAVDIDGDKRLTAILLMLLVPLSYGADTVYIHRFWPKDLSMLQVATGETLVACAMLLPFYLFISEPVSFVNLGPGHYAVLWYTVAGIIEVLVFFYLIEKTGAVLISFGSIISLLAGIYWGVLLFGESHTASVWLAIGLLAAALLLVALDEQKKAATA